MPETSPHWFTLRQWSQLTLDLLRAVWGKSIPAHSVSGTQIFTNQRLFVGEHTPDPSATNQR